MIVPERMETLLYSLARRGWKFDPATGAGPPQEYEARRDVLTVAVAFSQNWVPLETPVETEPADPAPPCYIPLLMEADRFYLAKYAFGPGGAVVLQAELPARVLNA